MTRFVVITRQRKKKRYIETMWHYASRTARRLTVGSREPLDKQLTHVVQRLRDVTTKLSRVLQHKQIVHNKVSWRCIG